MTSQEQPEDQPADDQTPDDQVEAVDAGTAGEDQVGQPPKGSAEDERIEELTEHIEKARSTAEDAGVLHDPDEAEYADSGATPSEDDQTITPPG